MPLRHCQPAVGKSKHWGHILRTANPSREPKSVPKRRKRRTTDEVVDRILAAASAEFECHGYTGATTAAIAKRARVAEPLIFSNFGSKSKLFRDSIFVPMNKHLLDFFERHLVEVSGPAESVDQLKRKYLFELEEFVAQHSRKFISLFFAQVYEKSHGLDEVDGLQDYFAQASALDARYSNGVPGSDAQLMARFSFLTVFSCIVFRDWIFPKGMVDHEKMKSLLTDFVIGGLDSKLPRN